ncbi:MAG: tRNA lysidine(34) synthetase TilS [Clostridia bacterium]|nr:tRNA lysidine(34) synthetase TilS [Clostridia bacterium]
MFNKDLFNKKEVVAVALSGGMDSVCLAHLLFSSASELGITVKAINIEHGIRGQASVNDSAFVKDFCIKLGIELKSYSVSVPKYQEKTGFSEEQAARILRYECFDNALIDGFCDKIATAHHMDDSVETVLFNLFRGSALSGVCGISETAKDGKIVRPLLNCSRQQIEEYVKKHELPFVTDETNDCTTYSRNYIRKELLPLINEKFNGGSNAINRFSKLAFKDDLLLNSLASQLIHGNEVEFTDELHLPLFNRACLKVMQSLGITKDFESAHLEAIYSLKDLQTGKRIQLKQGVCAYKSKNRVVFEKEVENSNLTYPITIPCEIDTEHYIIKIEKAEKATFKNSDGVLYFDGDKLPYNAIIRTKRTGDSILTFGGQNKSLKKYFTDKKIDARISKHLPLIAVESEIYAVCSIDISKRLKVEKSTKNIIKLICKLKGD